jgi:hypothetical protein
LPGRDITSLLKKPEAREMVYTMEESHLARLWTVVRYFELIREIQDPAAKSEILTRAQILLTAFVLELKPLDRANIASPKLGRDLDQTARLAA